MGSRRQKRNACGVLMEKTEVKRAAGRLKNGWNVNPLNAELNPICPSLTLVGAHHILHVSRKRVNIKTDLKERG